MTRKMNEYDPTIIFEPRPVVVVPGTAVFEPGPPVFEPTIIEAREAEEIRIILEGNAMIVQAQQMQAQQQTPTVQQMQVQQTPTVQQAPTVQAQQQMKQAPTVQVHAQAQQMQRVHAQRVQEPTKKQQLAQKLLGERQQKENKHSRCGCYKEGTTDARCCGLCYCLCPARHISRHIDRDRCDFCPETFTEYLDSGYVRTHSGYGIHNHNDGFCTCICLPFKFPFFFPCAIGSIINSALNRSHFINCCCYSERDVRNYLF